MLLSLSIRNFVIVDTLTLDFDAGFTALTGETGAGKSILIDALLLALGAKAEADVVRPNATRADISAEFELNAHARDWLDEHALLESDEASATVLMRRTVERSGRSKAFINGTAATLAQLRELGELLVDVHGQHAHQSLLKPAAQSTLLDEHGGLHEDVRTVAEAWAAWQTNARALAQAQDQAANAATEQERLTWIEQELAHVSPLEGEWANIEAEHRRLSHGASLLEGASSAAQALSEAEDAALSQIDAVRARLNTLTQYDEALGPIVSAIDTARAHIDDAARSLKRYSEQSDLDAARLAEVEARLSALHSVARKFKTTPDALPELWVKTQAQLASLSASTDLDALRVKAEHAESVYQTAAQALSKRRNQAAGQMSKAVTCAMQDLSMRGGQFEVMLEPCKPYAQGLERVEFLVSGHAGVAPKPLAKVASGGELARISLAIAVIAATATPVGTLIFDEVDAGIGGAVAETVGQLLQQLGQSRQVLCVTHLPQVAARAQAHLVVSKTQDDDGLPVSCITPLNKRGRVEEIARMLGGVSITDTTRKHAKEMLATET